MTFLKILLAVILIFGSVLSFANYNRALVFSWYNHYRPMLLDGGGNQCLNELTKRGVTFTSLGDQGSADCPVLNAVKVKRFQNTKPSSAFILSCPTAVNLSDWLQDAHIKQFTHMGTINCRRMRDKDIQSEHSFGTAIDISGIDGAIIKKDWKKPTAAGDKLSASAKTACQYFTNVLTPDYNRLHADHFHLDTGLGVGCTLSPVLKTLREHFK